MDPVVENGIEKLFYNRSGSIMYKAKITNLRANLAAFQKSNAIFH